MATMLEENISWCRLRGGGKRRGKGVKGEEELTRLWLNDIFQL